nr:hypothetical protein [Tanacetum cinerariifolium]
MQYNRSSRLVLIISGNGTEKCICICIELRQRENLTKDKYLELVDALKTVENDDELGANEGISKMANNVVNPNVVTRSLKTNREKNGSNIEKNKESVLADVESESDVDEVYNER